jgi:choline dehydrogenase-like flavoprotein
MTTPVDVLIIGAGASGAAVAWSLAETKMHILCLEQGDWMKPSEYPSTRRDWEARQFNDFHISPNRRGRDTDYPINDANSPIKIANFNGVGGGTVLYAGHFPRFHPSDFRVRTLDGVADDWPIDYPTLEPFYAENDRMMGVSGLVGDPAYPPHEPMMPPLPLGKSGQTLARGLNKLGWHWWPSDSAIASAEYEGRAKCINLGHCTSGCAGRQGQHRHYLLARRHPRRSGAAHALPDAGDHHQRTRHGVRRGLLRPGRGRAFSGRRSRHPRLQRRRHGSHFTEFRLAAVPRRPRQFQRSGRQAPNVPSLCAHRRLFRRDARWSSRPARSEFATAPFLHPTRVCARRRDG